MRSKGLWFFCPVMLFLLSIINVGCSFTVEGPPWSGSGFIRKEFLRYRAAAVLPFEGDPKGEASDTFAEDLHQKFPQIELVRREQVLKAFQERDLSDQMDEVTRRKIGQTLGVQALVMGNVYYPSIVRWFLQVQVVDVETGEVMGRSLVEMDYAGAEGVKEGCKIAVRNLAPR